MNVNVDPGIQRQRLHDGYSEPESESEDDRRDPDLDRLTPGKVTPSSGTNAYKPSSKERTLQQDTALWHREQSRVPRP